MPVKIQCHPAFIHSGIYARRTLRQMKIARVLVHKLRIRFDVVGVVISPNPVGRKLVRGRNATVDNIARTGITVTSLNQDITTSDGIIKITDDVFDISGVWIRSLNEDSRRIADNRTVLNPAVTITYMNSTANPRCVIIDKRIT